MFEPQNDLEALMQAAVKDSRRIPAFYKTLLETEIYILTPEAPMKPGQRRSLKFREKLNIATVEFQGLRWLPAFTSKSPKYASAQSPKICLKCCRARIFG